jgi:hypothetical protein
MNTNKITNVIFLTTAVCLLLGCFFLSACSPLIEADAAPVPPESTAPEISPEIIYARDLVLAYLNNNHVSGAPPQGMKWSGMDNTAPGLAGSASFGFISGDWSITVSFPVTAPDAISYSVDITCISSGFHWQGTVDGHGQVAEISPKPPLQTYNNTDYRLSFTYSPEWLLKETSAGQPATDGYPASQALELVKNNYRARILIKFYWDKTIIGGGLGPGEVQQDGSTILLMKTVERNLLVNKDKIKTVWYGDRFDDLELYIRLEDIGENSYDLIAIPEDLIVEVETILASFIRTGEPFTPPNDLEIADPEICHLSPRLTVGGWAQVTPGLPNVIRSAPGRAMDSIIIGEITGGTTVHVLEGPVCASGYHWWRVDSGLVSGWTAEGGEEAYWLTPIIGEVSIPVNGWVGVLVSTPEWPQINDYFQVHDQGESRYGIHAYDADLRQHLKAYHDTGTLIKVWGTLYYGRMDAYNTQIEVTHFETLTHGTDSPTSYPGDWVGVIIANPPGAQFDDYFQMMDQNGTRYGIDSLDESIRQQIVALRGCGQVVHIWGMLTLDVPDAYGAQILVTQLEFMP